MQFAELMSTVKAVSFAELRKDSEGYFEAVVIKQELVGIRAGFEKFFGVPMWPSKNKISSQVQGIIKDYGGLMPNQTLYFLGGESETVFAMLWPWQDGVHITVKVIRK